MNRRNIIAAGIAGISAASAVTTAKAQGPKPNPSNPELEAVRALLKAHDEATTAHDLDAVLATIAEDGAIMGTGPEEMWAGHEELAFAYKNFFTIYDKGEQGFEYDYRVGDLMDEMGWMMTSGTVVGKKDGEEFAYPLNVSLTVTKVDGDWKIQAMHFSTFTSADVS